MIQAELYIRSVLLKQFLGIDPDTFTFEKSDQNIVLSFKEQKLTIKNQFFSRLKESFLGEGSLPKQPLKCLDFSVNPIFDHLPEKVIPVIYGTNTIEIEEQSIHLGVDIFGSCFFMLTRYEEVVKRTKDKHDRFPATASLAYQEGFLERPIVDEYVEILWCCLKYLWPDLKRKEHSFQKYISCDVDWFFDVRYKWPKIIKSAAGDLLKRKSFATFIESLRRFVFEINSYDTFDFIMDTCESKGVDLAFYFIALDDKEQINGDYNISSQRCISLLKRISQRGHEIGLHLSYYTYRNLDLAKSEYERLNDLLTDLDIKSGIRGGRQHYLRWRTPKTANIWNDLGLEYDSTLGFADHIGFRCGTCREYNFFDIEKMEEMSLKIRPLVVMDVSLLEYMNEPLENVVDRVIALKNTCKQLNGNFTLLWHNNFLSNKKLKDLYQSIIFS